ncbi:zinc finger and BTB domain containing 49 [Phyllostomus discolor]|uniref:Zinc finger and BTB domain containing 49 n=1 Tax=Phyllostomus discolor TaxID=89673 RepID=A0A834BQ82_9CHIR|nr:zinc finger and BTB domain containing 49 [Phyllostomus discolor]
MDPVAAHGCHLLQQLHEQRIQGLLCDCTLVVRGVCFKAHKNVLAAFSQCFRQVTCRLTCVGILGRSRTSAKSAARGSRPPGTCSATSSFTPGRSRTCATSAAEGSATSAT